MNRRTSPLYWLAVLCSCTQLNAKENGSNKLQTGDRDPPAPPSEPLLIAHIDVEADTLVKSGVDADRNFGAELEVEADAEDDGEVAEAYLRFVVPMTAVEAAIIRVFVANGSEAGVDVRAFTDTAWPEMTVTWNTKPPIDGQMITALTGVDEDGWAEIDATERVRELAARGGKLSVALVARSGDGFAIHSRENPRGQPQLVLAYRGAVIAPPGPPPPAQPDASEPPPPPPPPPESKPDASVVEPDASTLPPMTGNDAVLVGAGDIGDCESPGDEQTAALLDQIVGANPGAIVFTAGDNAYGDGTAEEFMNCYDVSGWGRHKSITRPSAGNHDYHISGASGYFEYFGANAGDPTKGYYSYDHGSWHIVVLNSNCEEIGGCDVGSPQEQWLRNDLASSRALCTLAYWHHPRFSSGSHGDSTFMQPLWQALYDAGADIALTGHDHNYERFVPLNGAGDPDPARGITEFVVGTGGRDLRSFSPGTNTAIGDASGWGIFKLTLKATSADFEQIPVPGNPFSDSGTINCH